MADPRFFHNRGPFALTDLATRCAAALPEGTDGTRLMVDLAPLDTAQSGQLTFLENKKYRDQARITGAGACFVKAGEASLLPDGCVPLLCQYPYKSYAMAAYLFYPPGQAEAHMGDEMRHIDPTARIHPTAIIGANVVVGAGSVVDAYATIARGCVVGKNCYIGAHVSVSHTIMGNYVRLFTGARIGQPGFGYAIEADGNHVYVPQLGRVMIEDGVEIGANTTVDRGAGPDTVIGAGTKIDNLCQIGHNVTMGRGCFVAGQAGISGSTKIGNGVFIGGQAGFAGHITVGDRAQIAAQSGIMQPVDAGQVVMGAPAVPIKEFMRREAWLRKVIRDRTES